MKHKDLIYISVIALLLFSAFLFWANNSTVDLDTNPDNGGNPPGEEPQPISGKCGIESCHGLDIVCGPNVPEVCTAIYMAGDNCRQFAQCATENNQCSFKSTPQFEGCKSCVEKCELEHGDSPTGFFECESTCWNQA